ncbi:hypothetical protein KJ765_01315 [Candidatus Micrarchaeota archaeon]|nr:hypothetical protein [Candidatus Micrarchaeota archaeon]
MPYAYLFSALSGILWKGVDVSHGIWRWAFAALAGYYLGLLLSFSPQASSVFIALFVARLLHGQGVSLQDGFMFLFALAIAVYRGILIPMLLPFAVLAFIAWLAEELKSTASLSHTRIGALAIQHRFALVAGAFLLSMFAGDYSLVGLVLVFEIFFQFSGRLLERGSTR